MGHATKPDIHATIGVTMDPLASMQLGHDHHATKPDGHWRHGNLLVLLFVPSNLGGAHNSYWAAERQGRTGVGALSVCLSVLCVSNTIHT